MCLNPIAKTRSLEARLQPQCSCAVRCGQIAIVIWPTNQQTEAALLIVPQSKFTLSRYDCWAARVTNRAPCPCPSNSK